MRAGRILPLQSGLIAQSMLQHVHILTLTHRHAKLKAIGTIVAAFEADGKLQERLTALKETGKVDEVFYLSTCNRVSLLFTTRNEVDQTFRDQLLPAGELPAAVAEMEYLRGMKAVYHLFEVSASIDSLVVGERQILGQLREAYERCREWGLIGDDLRIVCDRIVLAAKDVYSNTSNYAKGFDVMIICTGSAEATVTPELFHGLLAGEDPRDKIVVDLGVPADVAEATVTDFDFEYVGIEQLRTLAEENMGFRRTEIKRAHGVLHKHLGELESTYRQRLLERAMSHLPQEIKAIKHTAVNQIFAKEIKDLDPDTRDLMLRMMSYMEKRCIGIPMKAAREAILG